MSDGEHSFAEFMVDEDDDKLLRILDLMTAHAVNPGAAMDLVQEYVPLHEVQENIADMENSGTCACA